MHSTKESEPIFENSQNSPKSMCVCAMAHTHFLQVSSIVTVLLHHVIYITFSSELTFEKFYQPCSSGTDWRGWRAQHRTHNSQKSAVLSLCASNLVVSWLLRNSISCAAVGGAQEWEGELNVEEVKCPGGAPEQQSVGDGASLGGWERGDYVGGWG